MLFWITKIKGTCTRTIFPLKISFNSQFVLEFSVLESKARRQTPEPGHWLKTYSETSVQEIKWSVLT